MNLREKIVAIQNIILHDLPGENVHREMAPIDRLPSSIALKEVSDYKESAVSIILVENNQTTKIVLIQRPTYDGMHSGQIAFPGGKKELSDKNLLQTSIRECHEEIGIDLKSEIHLGQLTPVYIPVSNYYVEPHVFYFQKNEMNYHLDPNEVAEVFTIELMELLNPVNQTIEKIRITNEFIKEVPCFKIKEKTIWGATALMLNELKEIILKLT
jgi:8-oxo-dGTP pyrophosphatase MutT (NUDIX family)